METTVNIDLPKKERDYFPAVFTNKDDSILILADKRVTETTFSGMIIHSANNGKNAVLGRYSEGWTYAQFSRLPLDSKVSISIIQKSE